LNCIGNFGQTTNYHTEAEEQTNEKGTDKECNQFDLKKLSNLVQWRANKMYERREREEGERKSRKHMRLILCIMNVLTTESDGIYEQICIPAFKLSVLFAGLFGY
jgi:hypothetical protein